MDTKKLGAALLTGVLAASMLAGCGSTEKESASSTESSADKVYTIACDAKYAPFSMEVDGKCKGISGQMTEIGRMTI